MPSNTATLTRLLLAERPSLLRLVLRIVGSKPAAEDITQTLYLKVQQVEDDIRIDDPRAYLFRLASNLALDHRRFQGRRDAMQTEIENLLWVEDDSPSVERTVLARDELQRVSQAVALLGEPTRTIFYLNRFKNLPQRAIAAQFGVSTTIVERHIRRALQALAQAREEPQEED